MSERAYTVKEIDDLRRVCRFRIITGYAVSCFPQPGLMAELRSISPPGQACFSTGSYSYSGNELKAKVERRVRTCMLAGTLAEHIIEQDRIPAQKYADRICRERIDKQKRLSHARYQPSPSDIEGAAV